MLELSADTRELQEEKRKDYRNVVAAQSVLLLVSLFTDDWFGDSGFSFHVFTLCAAVYLGLLWDLSRNFTLKRWVPRTLGAVGLTVVLSSIVYNNFLWTPRGGIAVNVLLHGTTIAIQAVVLWLGLRDLLRGSRNAVDKLWAAAGLYLMIGIAFGESIHLLHLLAPDTLGPGLLPDVRGFHEALYVSFVSLTGADNDLKGVSHFCRNLLVVEALVAQLFLVMLISRLLLPAEDTRG